MIRFNYPQRGRERSRHSPLCRLGRALSIILLIGCCALTGCATAERVRATPNRDATIGTTKEALLQCAGQPVREAVRNHSVLFLYYNEAPMLEESFPGSKGSVARPHHGCWASVLLEDDHVTDIGYRSVPKTIDATDHCENIFESCRP